MQKADCFVNPYTGKSIGIGSKTHGKILHIQELFPNDFEKQQAAYYTITNKKVKPKYADLPEEAFCGQEGGYPEGVLSFPVNSEKRCQAALRYAHNAPNPEGIRECAEKKAEQYGWTCGDVKEGKPKKGRKTKEVPEEFYQEYVPPKQKTPKYEMVEEVPEEFYEDYQEPPRKPKAPPRSQKQLEQALETIPAPKKGKVPAIAKWMKFLKEYQEDHPQLTYKQAQQEAKLPYQALKKAGMI
jgi:hypothetical protein